MLLIEAWFDGVCEPMKLRASYKTKEPVPVGDVTGGSLRNRARNAEVDKRREGQHPLARLMRKREDMLHQRYQLAVSQPETALARQVWDCRRRYVWRRRW